MLKIAKLASALLAAVLLIMSALAFADTSPQRVVYVNGIRKRPSEALDSVVRIRTILNGVTQADGTYDASGSPNHASTKRLFTVTNRWNPSGWNLVNNQCFDYQFDASGNPTSELDYIRSNNPLDSANCLFQDNVEVAMMKTSEERYRGWLDMIKSPHDMPSVYNPGALAEVAKYADLMYGTDADNTGLVKSGIATTATMQATSDTIGMISHDMIFDSDSNQTPVIVIAHSQGNLLANLAYAKMGRDTNSDPYKRVRIINIANVSALSLHNLAMSNRGDGILYDSIVGLRPMIPAYDAVEKITPGWFGGSLFNNTWWRITPACGGPCEMIPDDPTLDFPDGELSTSTNDHTMLGTYLSLDNNRTVGVIDARGVNYTPGATRFRDRFEDLVYTAVGSLEKANPPQTVWQSYIDTDLSTSPQNMNVSGLSPHYDSALGAYVVDGTDSFTIGLPSDQTAVLVRSHMKFIVTDDQPIRFAFKSYSPSHTIAEAFYLSMRRSDGCLQSTNSAYSLDGGTGAWQCRQEIPIDMNRLVSVGWVQFNATYDQRDCTMKITITPDDGSQAMGGTVALSQAQCTSPRSSFSFTPGAWNNNGRLLFNHLNVVTYKAGVCVPVTAVPAVTCSPGDSSCVPVAAVPGVVCP